MEYNGRVTANSTSQAVVAGEVKSITELSKKDLVCGHRKIDLGEVAQRVIIPGMKVREQAEIDSNR